MFSQEVMDMLIKGIGETLYMTLGATIFWLRGASDGYSYGDNFQDGIRPNAGVYKVLDVIVNIGRSIPFLILLILLMPLTKAIVGKSYGSTATIVPLVISAAPFIARMVESSLNEVDSGVIEAAKSMGASTMQIITKVMLVEARTSLIVGVTITLSTVLGYSAMAGTISGGGLGDIAIRYGYYRYQADILIVTVVLLVVLVQLFQTIGMKLSVRWTKKKVKYVIIQGHCAKCFESDVELL